MLLDLHAPTDNKPLIMPPTIFQFLLPNTDRYYANKSKSKDYVIHWHLNFYFIFLIIINVISSGFCPPPNQLSVSVIKEFFISSAVLEPTDAKCWPTLK
jgi:hypothetical protein